MFFNSFYNAIFYKSFHDISKINIYKNTEIAFFGYSNCGKSSVINSLTNQKKLSRVSKKPGSTNLVNFFKVNNDFFLVDLPGYGYVNHSKKKKKKIQNLLFNYLQYRQQLIGIILLMDIRNPLKNLDRIFLDYVKNYTIPVVILLTKSDKLSTQEQNKQLLLIKKKILFIENILDIIIYSSLKKKGIELLKNKIIAMHQKKNTLY
ncbi:ribosome biogenesis GTP-binding protein YihA/YsxC [Buchnera aphidicola (Mollitrichosiphum nigrofasciatum)]|uniref:ribosome biogenesis GTP-binding protein YihA/YsxC n=1 Tax=Buchnera aphidicola TaxID=9 RepID=UPI0031B81ACF